MGNAATRSASNLHSSPTSKRTRRVVVDSTTTTTLRNSKRSSNNVAISNPVFSELDEFLQTNLSEIERDALNSNTLDDRVQHLMTALREKGILPAQADGSDTASSKKLFEPGIVSTEKYEWCSPNSDQFLADLEATEGFEAFEEAFEASSSPRLRQLRDLSWSVRGTFWEDQVKRALLFAFVRRRWSSNDSLVRKMSSSSSSTDLFATTRFSVSGLNDNVNTNNNKMKMNNNLSNNSMMLMLPAFQGISGTGLPPYARMCIQMVMQLATMQLSRLASESPSQALQFVRMMKMNMIELRNHRNQHKNSSSNSVYDQAMESLSRAMSQLATSPSTSNDLTTSLLRSTAAEIVVELSLIRQKLSGLVNTQLMLIKLSMIDTKCQLQLYDRAYSDNTTYDNYNNNNNNDNSKESVDANNDGGGKEQGINGLLSEIESHLISPLAAPAAPPAGLGMIHTFLITAPPGGRSRRVRSPPVSPSSKSNVQHGTNERNGRENCREERSGSILAATTSPSTNTTSTTAAAAAEETEETEQEEKNQLRTRAQRATAREVFIRSGRAAALGRAMHTMRTGTARSTGITNRGFSRSDSALIAEQIVDTSIRQALEEATAITTTSNTSQSSRSVIENRRYQQSPQPPSTQLTTPLPMYRGNSSLSHPLRPRVLRGNRSTSPMITTTNTVVTGNRGLTTPTASSSPTGISFSSSSSSSSSSSTSAPVIVLHPPSVITLGRQFVLHFQCEGDVDPGEDDWIGLYHHREENSTNNTNDDSVGERFYRATAERQRQGIVWEAQCGPPTAGWFEFRYFRGSGSQTLAAVSATVRAVRRFASIASSGHHLFVYNEEGLQKVGTGTGQSVSGELCAGSTLPFLRPPSVRSSSPPPMIPSIIRRSNGSSLNSKLEHSGNVEEQQQQQHRRRQDLDELSDVYTDDDDWDIGSRDSSLLVGGNNSDITDKAPGWIAFCNQKLYIRSVDVNGAVAVISPDTLEVEKITTLLGGGQPELGSMYDLAPAISRETEDSKIPMFSDGKLLYFARFEKQINKYGTFASDDQNEDEIVEYDEETEGSKLETLQIEEKFDRNNNSSSNSSSGSGSVSCTIDVIDPSRNGALVKRITLCDYGKDNCVGDNSSLQWDTSSVSVPKIGTPVALLGASSTFEASGVVRSWTVRTTKAGSVTVVVWRRVSRNRFMLVGTNVLPCSSDGQHTLRVPKSSCIRVSPGDVIGTVIGDVLCHRQCSAEDSDDKVRLAYGNNWNSSTGTAVVSRVYEFQTQDHPTTYAVTANINYDDDENLPPWEPPRDVFHRISPENTSMYTNGDEIGLLLDLNKIFNEKSGSSKDKLGKRCYIFSAIDGSLKSETSVPHKDTSCSSRGISIPRTTNKVESMSTCYDVRLGCLWTVAFDSSQVTQYAACPYTPCTLNEQEPYNEKYDHTKTTTGFADSTKVTTTMTPLETSKRLIRLMCWKASASSPSEVHVQSCTAARSRRIDEENRSALLSKDDMHRLHLGQSVTARYGPGWFAGEISRVNRDGTYGILYADGDRRSSVRPESIKVVQSDGSEIVATKWVNPKHNDKILQTSGLRIDEEMLSESGWCVPSDDTLEWPYSIEISVGAFVGLHDLILTLVHLCRSEAEEKKKLSKSTESILVGALSLLRVNAQRLLLAGVDCNTFNATTVRSIHGTQSKLLDSIKDILHHIFTGTWLEGTSTSGLIAQNAASAALTDGLDLWFTDPWQQIELLHAILGDDSSSSSSSASVKWEFNSAYDSLLYQFAREGAVNKLVRTAVFMNADTMTLSTCFEFSIIFQRLVNTARKEALSLVSRALKRCNGQETNEECSGEGSSRRSDAFPFPVSPVNNSREGSLSPEVDKETQKAHLDKSTTSPVLKLLSALQMEVLMLASEKGTDLQTPEGKPLLVNHATSVLKASIEVVRSVLRSKSAWSDPLTEWEVLSEGVRTVVECTFVGSILPMLCTIITSILFPFHDVPSNLVDLHDRLRQEQQKINGKEKDKNMNYNKWCVEVKHESWVRVILTLATEALSCFDQLEQQWNDTYSSYRVHRLNGGSTTFNSASADCPPEFTSDMPYEILHVEPKIHFIRRQLSGLVGALSGALIRLIPSIDKNHAKSNNNGTKTLRSLSATASKWMNSSISHLRADIAEANNGNNKETKSINYGIATITSKQYCTKEERAFLNGMVTASHGVAKAARHLAWKAKSPKRVPKNDLSVDGSAHGHLQELARVVSHKVRRNLAVRVHSVNEAERAVAAAMIYHSGMTSVAQRYAEDFEETRFSSSSDDEDILNASMDSLDGRSAFLRAAAMADNEDINAPPTPPKTLIYIWKQARKARKWLKQQKDKVSYTGGAEAYDELATSVRDRALLLLELRPSYLSISFSDASSSNNTNGDTTAATSTLSPEIDTVLSSVLSFVTSSITHAEMSLIRRSISTAPIIFNAREHALRTINNILLKKESRSNNNDSRSSVTRNPDTLLHVLVPVVEAFRHLPSAMTASGLLIQDKGIHCALLELYETLSTLIQECYSNSESSNLEFLNTLDNTRQQQWRSLLCTLMDATVSLTPVMQVKTLMSSSVFASLLKIALNDCNDENNIINNDTLDVEKREEIDKSASAMISFTSTRVNRKNEEKTIEGGEEEEDLMEHLWKTELKEVVVIPSVEVSSINFAQSPDANVLLRDGGHWQSDGNLPHWIQLTLPQPVALRRLRILLMNNESITNDSGMTSRIDHSFCPRVLSISVGTSPEYLQEIRSIEVPMTSDWITVVDASDKNNYEMDITEISQQNNPNQDVLLSEVSVIKMEIAHNHMSGQNSRLAQLHITAAVPVPSEHSLLTRMKERMQLFAWNSARVVLDSVLSKLSRQQQKHHSGKITKSFLLCSRPLLKEYTETVLRSRNNNGKISDAFNDRVCRGLLPLILYADTDAVKKFFEDSKAFAQLVTLSSHGPVQSKTLALRLLRKLLPTRAPEYWDGLCAKHNEKSCGSPAVQCMLDMYLDRVGKYLMMTPNDEKEECEPVISEIMVLLRTLANSKHWFPSMRSAFAGIVNATLSNVKSEEDSKDNGKLDHLVLSRCAAVFSVVGGYKDTLRVGGYATWSDNYKARRVSSKCELVDVDENGDVIPLLLILSIGDDVPEIGKKHQHNDSSISNRVVRVKIIRNEQQSSSSEASSIISVRYGELRAVSEVLKNPTKLLNFDSTFPSSSSNVLEVLHVLLSPRQPAHFTRLSATNWQELKTIALKASTELLRNKQTCEACARHPTFLKDLLNVATHPASEIAAITEAAEGIEALELQSRDILRLRKKKDVVFNGNKQMEASVTIVEIVFRNRNTSSPLIGSNKHGGETKSDASNLVSREDSSANIEMYTKKACNIRFKQVGKSDSVIDAQILFLSNDDEDDTFSEKKTDQTIVGELITTSELYTCSTNDCGGRGIILADQSEIEELDLHGDAKTAHALLVVTDQKDISVDDQLYQSISTMCPKPKVIASITREAMTQVEAMIHHQRSDIIEWRDTIEVGDRVDALFWPTGLWLRATIVDMDHRYIPSRRFVKLTYHGISEKFDIWTSRSSPTIAPLGSHSIFARHGFNRICANEYLSNWRQSMTRGTLVDAKDTMGNWYKSTIIDIKGDEIKIHYQGWKPRWDIWVNRSSTEVAPICTKTRPWRSFKKGDVLDANPRSRDDHTAWTEGVVVAVEYVNGSDNGLHGSDSKGMLRALQSELNLDGLDLSEADLLVKSSSTIDGSVSSYSSPVDRVLVRFPALHTEQWFNRDSEELCVPGTHVTSKRKEKAKKTVLPPSVRKSVQPRALSSVSRLMQLGFSKSVCQRSLEEHQGDLPSASAWLFKHARATSFLKMDSQFNRELSQLETVHGGTSVVKGARHYIGGKGHYHTTTLNKLTRASKNEKDDDGTTISLWIRGVPEYKMLPLSELDLRLHRRFSTTSTTSTSSEALFLDSYSTAGSKLESKDSNNNNNLDHIPSTKDRREYVLVKGQKALHGLHIDSKVRALYGNAWYDGRIRKINDDGTFTIVYSDGDVRLSVPRRSVKLSKNSCNPFQLYLTPSGHIELSICSTHKQSGGCTYHVVTSKHPFRRRKWTHVCFTIRSGFGNGATATPKVSVPDVAQLYINGMMDNSVELDGDILRTDWPVCIGGTEDDAGVRCTMHNLNIYARSLSSAEIIVDMRQGGDAALASSSDNIVSGNAATINGSRSRSSSRTNSRPSSPPLVHLGISAIGGFSGEKDDDAVAVKVQVHEDNYGLSEDEDVSTSSASFTTVAAAHRGEASRHGGLVSSSGVLTANSASEITPSLVGSSSSSSTVFRQQSIRSHRLESQQRRSGSPTLSEDSENEEQEHMNRMREQIRRGRGEVRDVPVVYSPEVHRARIKEHLDLIVSREISIDLRKKIQEAVRAAQRHALVVDVGGLTTRCGMSTYVEEPVSARQLLLSGHKILCKGAVVQGRVGSRWYTGRIHSLNSDQTLDVAFDDNDFRPSMPSDRVQVLVSRVDKTNERWVLASEIQKLSVPELQSIDVLKRKSKCELYRMSMSTELLLQCTYARYAVTALVRGWPNMNSAQPMTLPLFGDTSGDHLYGETKTTEESPAKESDTRGKTVLAFCRYLRMLSTHECSLSSKRKLMSWPERFESCGNFSGLATGTTFGDSSGGCSVTGTWLDGVRSTIKAMLSRERIVNQQKMRMTETLIYECMGNLVQLAWSSQSPQSSLTPINRSPKSTGIRRGNNDNSTSFIRSGFSNIPTTNNSNSRSSTRSTLIDRQIELRRGITTPRPFPRRRVVSSSHRLSSRERLQTQTQTTTHLEIPSSTSSTSSISSTSSPTNLSSQARLRGMTTTAVSTATIHTPPTEYSTSERSSTNHSMRQNNPTARFEQQILEARSVAHRLDLFSSGGNIRRQATPGLISSGGIVPSSAASLRRHVERTVADAAASAHMSELVSLATQEADASRNGNISSRSTLGGGDNFSPSSMTDSISTGSGTVRSGSSSSPSDGQDNKMCWSHIVWLHGKDDGQENKMLRGPNLMLSCWILDLLMESVEEYGNIMKDNTLWCFKKHLFNHRTLELLLISVHQCDSAVMPRLLPLLSRFVRILSMEVGGDYTDSNGPRRVFLDGGFDTQQFATLAQVTSQRYAREQLSMLRPTAGGVPIFSIYCQRLIELMVDVHRASKSATAATTATVTSPPSNNSMKKGIGKDSRKDSSISSKNNKKVDGMKNEKTTEEMKGERSNDDSASFEMKDSTPSRSYSISTTSTSSSSSSLSYKNNIATKSTKSTTSVHALSRRMKWSGLDLGEALPSCTDIIDLDDTIKTLYCTQYHKNPWIGDGLKNDITRVVGMMSSKLSISHDQGSSTIQRTPMKSQDRIELCEKVQQLEWSHDLDIEFVQVINITAQKNQKPCCHVLLEEIMKSDVGGGNKKDENDSNSDLSSPPSWCSNSPLLAKQLERRDERPWIIIGLQVRLETLRRFNRLLSSVLPLIDLRSSTNNMTSSYFNSHHNTSYNEEDADVKTSMFHLQKLGLGERIVKFRSLIFQDVKRSYFNRVLASTTTTPLNDSLMHSGGTVQLKLNRWLSTNIPCKENSIFMQAFRQLNTLGTQELSTRSRPWHVIFEGEAAEDAGGPFRSSLMFVCDDLISNESNINLLLPTKNQQYKVGEQRGKYTLIPGIDLNNSELIEFFGKLLGVGLRQQISCPLNITSTFWKHLTGETLDMSDVKLMDENSVAVINGLMPSNVVGGKDTNLSPSLELSSGLSSGLSWETTMTNGVKISVRGSESGTTYPRHVVTLPSSSPSNNDDDDDTAIEEVKFKNNSLYASNLFHSKIRESTYATSLLLRGLRAVVPADIFRLFTWEQLEEEICGVATMDVDLLARNCIFEVGDPSFQATFWQVLRSYNPRQQAQFLRFCWARDRLPLTDKGFRDQKLRIVEMRRSFAASAPDSALPEAATCSFTLTLPKYSSFNVMRRQLLIAIEGCTDYDLDGAARGFNVQNAVNGSQQRRNRSDLRTSTEIVNDRSIAMINGMEY